MVSIAWTKPSFKFSQPGTACTGPIQRKEENALAMRGGEGATINNNSMQSMEGGMEGRQIQNTKLEATCVLLVVITTVALTWSAKRTTSRINSAWTCSIPQGLPRGCCSIANNIVQFHRVWSRKQWNPRHRLTHTCVIVSSIIRCGVDSSWLVGEIVNIDRRHNTTSVWLMFRDPCYEAFAWVTPLKRLCCR